MIKKKIAIAISLGLLISIMLNRTTAQACDGYGIQMPISEKDKNRKEYEIGRNLAETLVLGCSIFIGTIRAVGEPIRENKQEEDRWAISHTEVNINVDEWLWGEQADRGSVLQIYKTSQPKASAKRGPWSLWEEVDLSVGKKLLVILWGEDMKKQRRHEGKTFELAYVVSDENVFPAVRDVVAQHARYMQNPDEIETAPRLIRAKKDFIFGGYLDFYLYRKMYYTDKDVLALIEMIGSNYVTEGAGFFTIRVLMKSMLSEYSAISDETRNAAIRVLIVSGSSNNLNLVKDAFTALIRLSNESKQFDMKAFLSTESRRKLAENYYKFFGNDPLNNKDHKNLKLQLGLETH